jgi:hypothetical protein
MNKKIIITLLLILNHCFGLECPYKESEVINSSDAFAIIHTNKMIDSTIRRLPDSLIIYYKIIAKVERNIFGKLDSVITIECATLENNWFEEDKNYLVYLNYCKEGYYICPGENNHCGRQINPQNKALWFKTIKSDKFHTETLDVNAIIIRTLTYIKKKKIKKS